MIRFLTRHMSLLCVILMTLGCEDHSNPPTQSVSLAPPAHVISPALWQLPIDACYPEQVNFLESGKTASLIVQIQSRPLCDDHGYVVFARCFEVRSTEQGLVAVIDREIDLSEYFPCPDDTILETLKVSNQVDEKKVRVIAPRISLNE